MSQVHATILTLVVTLWSSLSYAQNTELGTKIQDITTYPAFSQQKSCAQSCFIYGGGTCWEDVLGVQIGCAQKMCQPKSGLARNDCYCSAGLMKPAQEQLSNCVSSKCSVGDVSVDISIATSLYARYCNEKNYFAGEPVKVSATPTGRTTTNTRPASSSTPTGDSGSTIGTGSGSTTNSTPSSSMSVGTIIGIVVGSCAGLAFIAAAMWMFWKMFRSCRGDRGDRGYPQQHYPPSEQQQPVYPKMSEQQQWFSSPGPASEVGPSDSVSMVGGMARPAPTLVSDMRSQGRW